MIYFPGKLAKYYQTMKLNVFLIIASILLISVTIYGFITDEISLKLFLIVLFSSILLTYSLLNGLKKGD